MGHCLRAREFHAQLQAEFDRRGQWTMELDRQLRQARAGLAELESLRGYLRFSR